MEPLPREHRTTCGVPLPLDILLVVFSRIDLLSLNNARIVSKQWLSISHFSMLPRLCQYFNLPNNVGNISGALLSILHREQCCLQLIDHFLALQDVPTSIQRVRSICDNLRLMYIPVFRRHFINSNWEELKKQSKIEEPNYHQLEHLLAKVAFPRSPVYQVGGVGAEGYTNFMREYVEMIIVPTANNFVKLTLAWSWERNGNYPYLFTAVNVQNDATSEELELATFRYCTRHRHSNPQNEFFSWHDGIKLRYCTDFAVTPNEENMMLLKQWLNLGSAVSELQMYHFFRLLMLEFKPLSLLEMKPTGNQI
jgi:hypothetical protein